MRPLHDHRWFVRTTEDRAVAAGHSVDPGVDLDRWRAVLDETTGRIAGRFVRREPRAAAAAFVTGLLSTVERKTFWALAEQAGYRHPARFRRLLRTAVWDADAAAGDVRSFVADRLGHRPAGRRRDPRRHKVRDQATAGVGNPRNRSCARDRLQPARHGQQRPHPHARRRHRRRTRPALVAPHAGRDRREKASRLRLGRRPDRRRTRNRPEPVAPDPPSRTRSRSCERQFLDRVFAARRTDDRHERHQSADSSWSRRT